MMDKNRFFEHISHQPPPKSLGILKVTEGSEKRFAEKYDKDELAKIIKDIATKNTGKIGFFAYVDDVASEQYDLNSRDLIRILREGEVIDVYIPPHRTEMRVEMRMDLRYSSVFILTCFIDLDDNITLTDITITEGGEDGRQKAS